MNETTKWKWNWKVIIGWFAGIIWTCLLITYALCVNSITPPDFAYGVDYWNGGKVFPITSKASFSLVHSSEFARLIPLPAKSV